jgi:hypothetical protein
MKVRQKVFLDSVKVTNISGISNSALHIFSLTENFDNGLSHFATVKIKGNEVLGHIVVIFTISFV